MDKLGKREGVGLVFLVGLCALFFFYRLGAMALIGPDEPRYAQVAREMLARQDPITPTLGGHPWLEKPVLTYWLMALSMRIFGVQEFAARFPSALLATVVAFLLYGVGRRVHSPLYGFFSACLFVVNPMSFGFARGATTDMPLSATLAAGLLLLFLALEEPLPRKRSRFFIGACFCFGLAVLAKGLVGILFPLVIGGSYLLLCQKVGMPGTIRRIPRDSSGPLLRGDLLKGGLVFLLVCGSWYGPIWIEQGKRFVDEFFIQHHLERYVSERFQHPGPVYYYLPVLLVGFFPWTPLLLSALWRMLRKREGQLEGDMPGNLARFAALWILWPLLFFSFSRSKLPGYLLPVIPACALLGAQELLRIWRGISDLSMRVVVRIWPAFFLGIAVAAFFYARKELGDWPPLARFLLWGSLAGGCVALGLGWTLRSRALSVFLLALCALTIPGLLVAFQPGIERKESFRDLAQVALAELGPREKLIGYGWFHHSLTFYTNARSLYDQQGRVRILFSREALQEILRQTGTVVLVARQQQARELMEDSGLGVEVLWWDRGYALLRVKLLN